MAFQEKLIKRGSPTNGSGTYFWNIYKPGRSNVFDKNKSILRIVASREHVEKFIDELSEEMGKLIAIYYLNGVSSLDLHGQNLLVGIPLDPQRQAMLAVRDISDHWVFPYAPTGYIQLKYGPIPEPNWCRALYQGSAGIGSSCSRRSQDLTLMGFRKIAQGTGFDLGNEISPKTTSDIYNTLLGNPERYGPMIRKVRQMEIPPKVAGCLRSAGCPQARGLLTP
jgi:hypothetical protein